MNFKQLLSSYNDANIVTKLKDREAGSFIIEGNFWTWGNINLLGEYDVCCQIRVDVKKGKVRCISIPQYVIYRYYQYGRIQESKGPIFKKPYSEGYDKSVGSSRISAKIYLRTYIWTKIIMDRLTKHVTAGASGIENDDW